MENVKIHMMTKLTVVGGILLPSDESFRVEERLVGARLDIIDDSGLKIDVE
jgi:hypothetical protein